MLPARSMIEAGRLARASKSSTVSLVSSDGGEQDADVGKNLCATCLRCVSHTRWYSDTATGDSNKASKGLRISPKQHQKLLDRDFFLSVFSPNATKRDAKAYLSRYQDVDKSQRASRESRAATPKVEDERKQRLQKSGVNLGGLYGQARAIAQSPVFRQGHVHEKYVLETSSPLQVAVVKLRGIDELDMETRKGVALTLAQLSRLGLQSCVVVESSPKVTQRLDYAEWRRHVIKQCFKLANAVNAQSEHGARVLDQALGISVDDTVDHPGTAQLRGRVRIAMYENLMATLQRGFVAIIPPIAYSDDSKAQRVDADEAVLALTRELAGITRHDGQDASPSIAKTHVDKIVVLDPLGGLPAVDKADQSHIFVNLEQEYDGVRTELLQQEEIFENQRPSSHGDGTNVAAIMTAERVKQLPQHIRNLELIKDCLQLLPPQSSALLTTPSEAASSALFSSSSSLATNSGPSVGTRAKRNPLIHNLLTDKPTVSSSLPTNRTINQPNDVSGNPSAAHLTPATFFKRGMPLTIIPDPKTSPWTAPKEGDEPLQLESDPRIDFPRLLHLIEDSFGRPLDVQHYLNRIKGRIAGIIVAGEYEGGAILTWEQPSGHDSAGKHRPFVPYLDKFAVLRRAQGSGGVADIVFNAMVRTCLPDGVVWRSRKSNPVNKWYFERSVGTWKLPGDAGWCMFWTGNGVDFQASTDESEMVKRRETWDDYVDVCSGIEASWADRGTKLPD